MKYGSRGLPLRKQGLSLLEKEGITRLLIEGAEKMGVKLNGQAVEAFLIYLSELKKWNKKINLTAASSDREIVIRHFLDSLTPLKFLKGLPPSTEGCYWLLDIGSGGGFPGIPLKIAEPRLKVVLLESIEKKTNFLKHIIRTLGLSGIEAIKGRAEDMAIISEFKGKFDCVISRALAPATEFLRLAEPYRKEGGLIIAMKGPLEKTLKQELIEIKSSYTLHEETLPFTDRRTAIVIFQ